MPTLRLLEPICLDVRLSERVNWSGNVKKGVELFQKSAFELRTNGQEFSREVDRKDLESKMDAVAWPGRERRYPFLANEEVRRRRRKRKRKDQPRSKAGIAFSR